MLSKGNLIILSAPSGSGKTSLAGRVLPQLENISFSVSHTTRAMREGEREGKEYFFVSVPRFREMIERGEFLEWAQVYGNYYGTSRSFVEKQMEFGSDVLLDIDIQGALKVRQLMPEVKMIFVLPPSYEVLGERLRSRGLDDEEVIERRLKIARDEIEFYERYDYVIINQDLDESVDELRSVIVSIRCLAKRRRDQAEAIVKTFHEEKH